MANPALSVATGPASVPDESNRTAPHVTIRGLSKHYADATIYDRFDFDIPRGKLISVFGPNGCGKSTLINMIDGCAISLPCHREGEVPVGLMLAASGGADRRIFELAAAMEGVIRV